MTADKPLAKTVGDKISELARQAHEAVAHGTVNGRPVGGRAKPDGTTAKSPGRPPVAVQFFHDDKPMPESQNKLSSVAYQFTKGVDGDRPRITSTELADLLTNAGITDPTQTVWSHKLPNGIVLSTRRPA